MAARIPGRGVEESDRARLRDDALASIEPCAGSPEEARPPRFHRRLPRGAHRLE
jgi:hypothetical protein